MARPRRGRRQGGRAGQVALVVVLAGLLVALAGGLTWLLLKARADYVPRDVATLCPKAGYSAQTLVLIDTTDALASVTQTQVLQKLHDLVATIPKNGLLELRLLKADAETSPVVLSRCNPGDGSDIDPVTGNPQLAKKRWETEYSEKAEEALQSGIVGTEQDFSPILETIQRIAAEHLTSAHDRAIPSRLVVISDMIEHTKTYSHFRDGMSLEAFDRLAKDRLATDLAGADIEFWLVRRDIAKIDPKELSAFWLQWAEASNSRRPAKLTALMGM